jgi:hypothetical protein
MSSSSKRKKLTDPPNDDNMEDTTTAAPAEESNLPLSWRLQSIQQFGLRPVPPASAVAGGTEEAWKKYYKYRCQTEGIKEEQGGDGDMDKEEQGGDDDSDDEYDWGEENYGSKKLMGEWKKQLGYMEYEANDCGWHWTPKFGDLTWDDWDDDEIRSAEYYCHVWSPFAIPHAIALERRYHRRPPVIQLWNSTPFGATVWWILKKRMTMKQTNTPNFARIVLKMRQCVPA